MTLHVNPQFIDYPVARWAINATKNEVDVDWQSRAPLCYYARSRPETKGGMESATGGGRRARWGGLAMDWRRGKGLSRLLVMSREIFDVVVGASEMRSMENGVGGGWRVLWLDKRGAQESE